MPVICTSNALEGIYQARGPYKIFSSGGVIKPQIVLEIETKIEPLDIGKVHALEPIDFGNIKISIPIILGRIDKVKEE
jgi:hypothetical protein